MCGAQAKNSISVVENFVGGDYVRGGQEIFMQATIVCELTIHRISGLVDVSTVDVPSPFETILFRVQQ
jgi:hypothetical protein